MRALLFVMLVCAGPAMAQPKGERVQLTMPADYAQTREWREGDVTVTQWRRPADPREILECEIRRGAAIVTPIALRDSVPNSRFFDCTIQPVRDGFDNHYPYALWATSCRSRNAAGTRRDTLTKAMQGKEALYVLTKVFPNSPEDRDRDHWVSYLGKMQLCDSRLPDRPCRP